MTILAQHLTSLMPTAKPLPTQIHHFASNKHTGQFNAIAGQYGLKLNGDWNKELLPHLGRHPNEYHEFVLKRMKMAQRQAGACKDKFLSLFEKYVKQPIRNNPEKLKKSGWKKH